MTLTDRWSCSTRSSNGVSRSWLVLLHHPVRYVKDGDGPGGHSAAPRLKRLIDSNPSSSLLSAAKSMYASVIQNYFLNIDTCDASNLTAPTMKLAEEVMSPIATAICSRSPVQVPHRRLDRSDLKRPAAKALSPRRRIRTS